MKKLRGLIYSFICFPNLGRQKYIDSFKDYGLLDINSDINNPSSTEANQKFTKEGGSNSEADFISNNNNEVLYSTGSQVDQTEKNDPKGNGAIHLKREMGLWSAVSILVGMIIGKILEHSFVFS